MEKSKSIHTRTLAWTEEDISQMLEIEKRSFNHYDAYSRDDFERWSHYNPDLCIVAEIRGRIAGYVVSRVLPGICELGSLAVDPEFRHCGIGETLLHETEYRLNGYGIDIITLEVRRTNLPGLAFWQKMGFSNIGTIPGFYEDGEDAVKMRKVIAETG